MTFVIASIPAVVPDGFRKTALNGPKSGQLRQETTGCRLEAPGPEDGNWVRSGKPKLGSFWQTWWPFFSYLGRDVSQAICESRRSGGVANGANNARTLPAATMIS
jgi:hypothetical protein